MTEREDSEAADPARFSTPARRWGIAGMVLLAFGVRSLPFGDVFVNGRVLFTDPDAYYHMRRIIHGIVQGPFQLGFDPYLNYPNGAKAIWPPFMDGIIAIFMRPFYSPGREVVIERIVVWIPPLLGAATVYVLFRLAARHFDGRVAFAAASILSILSGHFWYSQIGFVDHHVAVSFFATLLLAETMILLRGPSEAAGSFFFRVRGARVGLVCAAILLVWPGGILYVALVEVGLFVCICIETTDEDARRWLTAAGVLNGLAFAIVFPLSAFNDWPQWGPYSAAVLSRFQPWVFAAGAALTLLCRFAWSGGTLERNFAPRLRMVSYMALALIVASGALIPDLRIAFLESWEWLGREESFQAMVGESLPIFHLRGEFTTQVVELRLSRFVYLAPLALVALFVDSRRRGRERDIVFYIAWTVALMGMTLLQKRFFNTFSVSLALLFGWTCVVVWDWILRRVGEARLSRLALGGLASVAVFWLLFPTWPAYGRHAMSIASRLQGGPSIYENWMRTTLAQRYTGEWIRRNTPVTSGLYDSAAEPEYGVLARWGDGHLLKYVAQRPTVVGNFGDDLGREFFTRARDFYSAEPRDAAALLESLGVRYVVTRTRFEGPTLARRLHVQDGGGLGRFRLVYESPTIGLNIISPYKVFEFVEGARVVGSAVPGQNIEALVGLTTNLGRSFDFKATAIADESGRYVLPLPYSNRGAPESTRPDSLYRIASGGRVEVLSVAEEDVVSGREIRGPSFD